MVSSWLSSNTETTQDTSGVEAIKSLFRSLNLNRARLPGTLTFRDDPPGPDKSLCQIVSRFSNSVDIDSNTAKTNTFGLIQHNAVKNASQESCNLNSRTESAIQDLSTKISNDEEGDVIDTGNCDRKNKRVSLNAESLETIKKWGSAKSFTPRTGDINNDTRIGLNSSHRKIVATCWPSTSATFTTNDLSNEHWPNCFINGENIFDSRNFHNNEFYGEQFLTLNNSFPEHPREPLSHLSECLDDTQTQPHSSKKKQQQSSNARRKNTLNKAKRLLEKVSRDKLFIDLDAIANGKKLKEAKIKNPYHRIHLSINNYFNSPQESPLISPTRSTVPENVVREVIDGRGNKSHGKHTKVISKRKSLSKIVRSKQQKKTISTAERSNENELKVQTSIEPGACAVTEQINVEKTQDKQLPDNHHPIDDKIEEPPLISDSLTDYSPVTAAHDKLRSSNNCMMDSHYYKRWKIDHTKNRLEAVLCGERRTVAKPSEILIPHSVRARHIFQSFANIPEAPETKLLTTKNIKKKPGHFQNAQLSSVNKNSAVVYSTSKPNNDKKSLPTKRITSHQDGQNVKQMTAPLTVTSSKRFPRKQESLIESNVPVLRSKTFIAAPKAIEVTRLSDNCQRLWRIYDESKEIAVEKKFENRHTKSLRMLKELLAQTDEESIVGESPGHSEGRINIDNSSKTINIPMNNMESQTSRKSGVSQSLQTLSDVIEHLDASTETEVDLSQGSSRDATGNSLDKFSSLSIHHSNRIYVDAQVSCSFPTNTSIKQDISHAAVKSCRMIETQTSRTSIQTSYKERKDTSVETVRLRLLSKYVNTERRVLIDSSTGKDALEVQNFCCDTQLTNTESTMFDDQSVRNLKLRINGVESQMNSLKSLINIGIQNTSTDISASLISSLSNQMISTERLSTASEKRGNSIALPDEVIRAFEIAAEKAQNLHRAIEIYREHVMNKREELHSLSGENHHEKSIINLLREEERKSQSLIVALEHISASEKALQEGLTKLVQHQEIQFTLETLLDQVAREVKKSNMKFRESITKKTEKLNNKIESEWICDLGKCSLSSVSPTSRTNILPIVYGAVCTLIFWSLQYSTSCEFG